MDSSNVTAPPTDSSTTSPPPPDATPPPSSDSSPPPPSSSPPPSSPPPSSSPPPAPSSPPPASSSPPPTQQDSSPTPQQSTSPPPATASPPPSTPSSSSTSPLQQQSSTPPPSSNGSPSWSPPPPSSNADDNNNNNSNSNNNSSSNNNTPSLSPPPSQSSSSSSSRNPSHSGALSPPPPPGHKSSSHMPSQTSSSSSSDDNSLSSSFNASNYKIPIIVGVTAGVVLLLIVMTLIIVSCCKKKKKKQRPHDQMKYYNDNSTNNQMKGYYADPSPVHKATSTDFYSSSGQQSNNWHNNMPSMNQVGTVPPPPQGALAPPPGGRWAPPPPPPPMMSSSEMSSNYSSGPKHPPLPPPSPSITLGFSKSSFSYDELAAATNGFSQANLLGQGGFGYVHRGVLANGEVVAVKSLKSGSCQGEREFQAEVEIISRVHHRHLVSLVGYCIAGGQRMLVYEFVSNKTLEYHLHGNDRPTMEWASRLRIALGSAKGLAYLHEDCHPRIIHRDIKAANILLDDNFEAMVADFGLAKLSSDNYTHVSTRVMGTFGYLAPEYASSGKLTEKSDVFSFGVMLLELITGRRPVDTTNSYMEDSLVDWARPLLTRALGDGNYEGLADPRLGDNYEPQEMARMVFCASASIRHSAKRRPKMKQIVHALEGDVSLEDLNEGVRAGQSSPFYSSESSDYDTSSYNADMKRFRKMALTTSQEMGSSEYGATSEYGLNPSSSSSGDSREMSRTHMH